MNAAQAFDKLYQDISQNITGAIADLDQLKVEDAQGEKELSGLTLRLRHMQDHFNRELELLEAHTEWDQFTMTFFGETNAGKSTLIESLRILLNETSRRQLIEQNQRDLQAFETSLAKQATLIIDDLQQIVAAYAQELDAIRTETRRLQTIMQAESEARLVLERETATAKQAMRQAEADARLALEREATSAGVQRQRRLAAGLGLAAGLLLAGVGLLIGG
jgi:ABC-type antimicrobial peptide transport system ATPase subunit